MYLMIKSDEKIQEMDGKLYGRIKQTQTKRNFRDIANDL